MFRRIALPLAGVCAVVLAGTGKVAAVTGSAIYSPEQAGYAATKAHFEEGEYNVTLPDASKFASEIGRLSFSVQLWATSIVIDLSVSTCTDASCAPGGTPLSQEYSLALNVFNRSTHALICSTSNGTCPGVPASWNSARLTAGQTASLSLFYARQTGAILASVNNVAYDNYGPGTGVIFNQARLSAEFGTTPWSTVPFKAPAAEELLARIGVPSSEAEIVTYDGTGTCLDATWTRHKVRMTSDGTSATPVEATPKGLSNLGCGFSLYLEP